MSESTPHARSVVVVIPTQGRAVLLDRTLASLAGATRPSGYRGTYIVENGPADPAITGVANHWVNELNVTFRSVPEGNKSTALNAVLAELTDELVVFLDDDVRVAPGLIEAYARADREAGEGAYFGGPTDVDYEVPPPPWLCGYLPPSAVGWRWTGHPRQVDEPAFLGFNWAARVGDLRDLGGFDRGFGPGAKTGATGQERDMQTRLLAAGRTGHFVEAALAWHYVPKSRCSQRWALRRAFRNGVSGGLGEIDATGPTVLGVPRWIVRSVAEKAVKALVGQFGGSAEGRFAALQQLVGAVGQVRGLRLRARAGRAGSAREGE